MSGAGLRAVLLWAMAIGLGVLAAAEERAGSHSAEPLPLRAAAATPNVWLIVIDDCDLALLRSPARHTPNLDAIFERAMIFAHGYAEGAVCRPSEGALLTGRAPRETGIVANPVPFAEPTENALAARLTACGYTTFIGGKFWPSNWGRTPADYGFQIAERTGNGTSQEQHGFVREGGQALFLDLVATGGPWYALWTPMLPHTPYDAPAQYAGLIDTQLIPPPPPWVTGPSDLQTYYFGTRDHLVNLAWFDDELGAGLSLLAATGQSKDTLIVVLADNGWSYGHAAKRSPFERGLRTWIAFAWPGRIAPGSRDDLVMSTQIPSTIAEVCGAAATAMDAPSLAGALLRGATLPQRTLVGGSWSHFPYPGDDGPTLVATWARSERYKFIRWHAPVGASYQTFLWWIANATAIPERGAGAEDLYDLLVDPDERVNVIADPSHVAALDALRAAADAWEGP